MPNANITLKAENPPMQKWSMQKLTWWILPSTYGLYSCKCMYL